MPCGKLTRGGGVPGKVGFLKRAQQLVSAWWLYAEGESGTHAGAVAQAARRLGIAVQNLGVRGSQQTGGEQAPVDRNQLLQMYSE